MKTKPYRNIVSARDLKRFHVIYKETDLLISAPVEMQEEIFSRLVNLRHQIDSYIEQDPEFKKTFDPHTVPQSAPEVVQVMSQAAEKTGVGPMAAVAGAIAEMLMRGLLPLLKEKELIIENGGDICLLSRKSRCVGIYPGPLSTFSHEMALEVESSGKMLGVCTSSGRFGHSHSLGKADVAIVIADSSALADAAATAVGNTVKSASDVDRGLQVVQQIKGVKGVLVICDQNMGIWGEIKLVKG